MHDLASLPTEPDPSPDPAGWREPDWSAVVRLSPVAVARFDRAERLVYLNPAARTLLGSRPEWAGRRCAELAREHPVFRSWEAAVREAAAGGSPGAGETEVRTSSSALVLRSRVVAERGPAGEPRGALVYADDVTEPRRREASLSRSATYDALSGVLNRESFLGFLRTACDGRASTAAEDFAVLFVDLDRFKAVNDRMGHATGDAVLRIVGERLQSCVRPSDVVGRLGGDEFAVLLVGVAHPWDGVAAVKRIQRKLAEPMEVRGAPVRVTASVGLVLGSEIRDPDAILAGADQAMYAAKELGDGHYQVVDTAALHVQSALETLDDALSRAVSAGELVLHYQPIVSLGDGRLVGLEALVRWNHPERGLIGPQAFLPVAEQSGRIAEVDRWVLDAAARQQRRWLDRLGAAAVVPVSVNLSASAAARPELCDHFAAALAEHGLEPAHLAVEITETALLELSASTVAAFSRLARRGVRIALDDFGTGYSSLSHLRHLALDALKIDRSFVHRLVEDGTDRAIVGSVLALAHSLGLCVVAEGVETAAQRDVLHGLGCDHAQGWLFGRPVPAEAVEPLLARGG
jgi:diguanylate cyclase (GGDEF)-like protein